jgi:NADH-quinone oxidoreductase subunit K
MIPLNYYLLLSVIIFIIGVIGFFIRRNLITLLMCVELLLNAASLAALVFGNRWNLVDAQVLVLLVMTVAAAEVALGLAIVILVFRHYSHLLIDKMVDLKE